MCGTTTSRSHARREAFGGVYQLHDGASDGIRMILLEVMRARPQMHDATIFEACGEALGEFGRRFWMGVPLCEQSTDC
jgi:hypothetical protein